MVTAPPAMAIFEHAQDVWEARRLPPYIEFDVRVEHRDATGKVTTGTEHVLLRTFDHWCRTREIDSDSPRITTSIGPSCVGPGRSPLGFNVSAQYPNSPEIDPFGSSLRTIASVRAIHYRVQFAGEESVDGRPCYRLQLDPIGDPDYYPLRALWVDEQTYDARKLTYAMRQNGWAGTIDYSFAPVPPSGTWWISSIDANWTPPPRDKDDPAFISKLVLTGITFPPGP